MRLAKGCLFASLFIGLTANSHAALPTSGTCAFTVLFPNSEFNWNNQNNAIGTTKLVDALGELNFSTQTVTLNVNTATLNAVSAVSGNTWVFSQSVSSASFANPAPTPLTGLPDASTLTFSFVPPSGIRQTVILNLLPANANNTFLIQGVNMKLGGVCQMV